MTPTTQTTPAQHDAAATAIVTRLDRMLREAVDRYGSVDAAADALIALMHEAVTA